MNIPPMNTEQCVREKRVKQMKLAASQLRSLYQMCDNTHGETHHITVANVALNINDKLGNPCDDTCVIAAAMLHNICNWPGNKEKHHEHAAVLATGMRHSFALFRSITDDEHREVVAAVAEHRSSYKGDYTSVLSELIASADRGIPDLESVLQRSFGVKDGLEELLGTIRLARKLPHRSKVVLAKIKHLKEKFGSDGYVRYPALYTDYYGDAVAKFQKDVDEL